MSESEQKLQEELKKAKEKNTELEKSLDAMSKEVMHLRSLLFRFDNIKADSKQLEFFTSLSRETWDCVWNFLGVQFCKDILSAKSAATEDKGRKIEPGSGRERTLSLEDRLLLKLMLERLVASVRSGQFVVCLGTSWAHLSVTQSQT